MKFEVGKEYIWNSVDRYLYTFVVTNIGGNKLWYITNRSNKEVVSLLNVYNDYLKHGIIRPITKLDKALR